MLVIDDLHWADKPTLLPLKHLIVSPVAALMVLCTYRDTDVDRPQSPVIDAGCGLTGRTYLGVKYAMDRKRLFSTARTICTT